MVPIKRKGEDSSSTTAKPFSDTIVVVDRPPITLSSRRNQSKVEPRHAKEASVERIIVSPFLFLVVVLRRLAVLFGCLRPNQAAATVKLKKDNNNTSLTLALIIKGIGKDKEDTSLYGVDVLR